MSRIRTLKPEWLDDEALHDAGMVARLLSVSLILLADDYGNGRANERQLAARVFWNEDDGLEKVREGLAKLRERGFLLLYTVRGQQYFHLCGWSDHQRVDKPGKPRVPGPEAEELVIEPTSAVADVAVVPVIVGESKTPEKVRESPGNFRETLAPDRDRDLDQERELRARARDPHPPPSRPRWQVLDSTIRAKSPNPDDGDDLLSAEGYVLAAWKLASEWVGIQVRNTPRGLDDYRRACLEYAANAEAAGDDATQAFTGIVRRTLEAYVEDYRQALEAYQAKRRSRPLEWLPGWLCQSFDRLSAVAA